MKCRSAVALAGMSPPVPRRTQRNFGPAEAHARDDRLRSLLFGAQERRYGWADLSLDVTRLEALPRKVRDFPTMLASRQIRNTTAIRADQMNSGCGLLRNLVDERGPSA